MYRIDICLNHGEWREVGTVDIPEFNEYAQLGWMSTFFAASALSPASPNVLDIRITRIH